jgi:hypothetical protein
MFLTYVLNPLAYILDDSESVYNINSDVKLNPEK